MIEVVQYYLLALLLFQPIEESYNCNNPNLINDVPHFVCVWEQEDFYIITDDNNRNTWELKKYRKKDHFIKAYYRRKYWEIR